MRFKEFKEIIKRRYTPKEALAFFTITADKSIDINVDKLVDLLIKELIQNNNRKELIDKLDLNSIEKIINYWNLSMEQVIAYGYIIFSNIIFEEKPFAEEEIADMFVYVMRLYSPNNAEEFVEKKLKNKNF